MPKKYLLIIAFLLLCSVVRAQQFFRIKADFSIKEKLSNNVSSLVMGTVYYDKNVKKVIYDITFPKKEVWVIDGNITYDIVDNKVLSKQVTNLPAEQSIFHIALSNQLSDYGLKNSIYKLEKVEKEGNVVISTWLTEAKNQKLFGKIMMSHIQKKLTGLVFHNPAGEILSKQIFKNYINVGGLEFPGEIKQTTLTKIGTDYRATTYKNIVINETNNSTLYNYTIPK